MMQMLKQNKGATFLNMDCSKEKRKMMRKITFLGMMAFAVLVFSSCLKKEQGCPYSELNVKAPQSEIDKVAQYLSGKGITAELDSSGVYYVVETAGSGSAPTPCSVVSVEYTGKFTNDQVFDKSEGTPVSFRLGNVIPGWQKGLKHVSTGGKIHLYIPPSLGYGSEDTKDSNGNIVIPASSILIFSVEIKAVQ